MNGVVRAVSVSATHSFSKTNVPKVHLLTGLGVEGDAHCGQTVRHRSRVAMDATQPNLRQVHLIPHELIDELRGRGFDVSPGTMGENVTTEGIDLIALPRGSLLYLGDTAIVEITGLRNPCAQLNSLQSGLMQAVLDRASDGSLVRRCGVMGIVRKAGDVCADDLFSVRLPPTPHKPLECV
jgi:MOSC domain-containing protein YiiM